MATGIEYVRGDATTPQGKGPKVIAHVCQDLGGWGFGLGAVQVVQVERLLGVADMVGQRGIRTGSKGAPVRY